MSVPTRYAQQYFGVRVPQIEAGAWDILISYISLPVVLGSLVIERKIWEIGPQNVYFPAISREIAFPRYVI